MSPSATGPLAGHTSLVTGGSKRIGATLCMRLAEAGSDVVIHHRKSATAAGQLATRIRRLGVQAFVLQADLADPKAAANLVAQAKATAGRPLSFLVNNASAFPADTLATLDLASFEQTNRANAWAPFELMRAFAAQVPRGAIVNILDARLEDPDLERVGYSLSKALLRDMTMLAARAMAPRINVNAVLPGPVLVPVDAPKGTPAPTGKNLPLRAPPEPDDIADAVLYLLGARATTGVLLPVDGGRHLVAHG